MEPARDLSPGSDDAKTTGPVPRSRGRVRRKNTVVRHTLVRASSTVLLAGLGILAACSIATEPTGSTEQTEKSGQALSESAKFFQSVGWYPGSKRWQDPAAPAPESAVACSLKYYGGP